MINTYPIILLNREIVHFHPNIALSAQPVRAPSCNMSQDESLGELRVYSECANNNKLNRDKHNVFRVDVGRVVRSGFLYCDVLQEQTEEGDA